MSRVLDMAKVVPGAWETIKAQRAEHFRRDPKAKAEWERRRARNAERAAVALKAAMLKARDESGLTQAEIAERMGVRPSNLSRLLHGAGGVNGATFAAFLRACGFGFTVALVPFPKRGAAQGRARKASCGRKMDPRASRPLAT